MWNVSEKFDPEKMTLHDCIATKIEIDGQDLLIDFPDGIWLMGKTKLNPNEETMRTDAARLRFENFELDSLFLYKEFRLFRKTLFTRRVDVDLDTLMRKINSGEWELEFLYTYRCYRWRLYNSCIWRKKGCVLESQLTIECDDVIVCWNKICTDRVW